MFLSAFNSFKKLVKKPPTIQSSLEDQKLLIDAIKNKDIAQVKLLIDLGVDPNSIDQETKQSALMLAVIANNYDLVWNLITQSNIPVNINYQHKKAIDGWTALMLALSNKNESILKLLLQSGANCKLKHNFGSSAYMIACKRPNMEKFQPIIKYYEKLHLSSKYLDKQSVVIKILMEHLNYTNNNKINLWPKEIVEQVMEFLYPKSRINYCNYSN